MDNELNEVSALLLECGLYLRNSIKKFPRMDDKFRKLEERLVVKKDRSKSFYNEIRSFHNQLGL